MELDVVCAEGASNKYGADTASDRENRLNVIEPVGWEDRSNRFEEKGRKKK